MHTRTHTHNPREAMSGPSLRVVRVVCAPAEYDTSLPTPKSLHEGIDTVILDQAGTVHRRCRTPAQTVACTRELGRGRRDETDGLAHGSIGFVLGAPTAGVSFFSGTMSERLRVARCLRACDLGYLKDFFRQRVSHARISLSDPIRDQRCPDSDGSALGMLRDLASRDNSVVRSGSILHMPDVCKLLGQPASEAAELPTTRMGLMVHGLGQCLRGPRLGPHAEAHREAIETLAEPSTETERLAQSTSPDPQATCCVSRVAGVGAAEDLLYERLCAVGALDWRPDGIVHKWDEQSLLGTLTTQLLRRSVGSGVYDVVVHGFALSHDFAEVAVVHNAALYVLYVGVAVFENRLQTLVSDGKHQLYGDQLPTDEALDALVDTEGDAEAMQSLRRDRARMRHAAQVLEWCRKADAVLDSDNARGALEALLDDETDDDDDGAQRVWHQWAREAAREEQLGPRPMPPERVMLCALRPMEWCGGGPLPTLKRGRYARELVVGGFRIGKVVDSKAGGSRLVGVHVDVGWVTADALSRRYEESEALQVPDEVLEQVAREGQHLVAVSEAGVLGAVV